MSVGSAQARVLCIGAQTYISRHMAVKDGVKNAQSVRVARALDFYPAMCRSAFNVKALVSLTAAGNIRTLVPAREDVQVARNAPAVVAGGVFPKPKADANTVMVLE